MHIDHPLDRARSNNKLISVSSTTEVLIHRREQAWVLDLSNFENQAKALSGIPWIDRREQREREDQLAIWVLIIMVSWVLGSQRRMPS